MNSTVLLIHEHICFKYIYNIIINMYFLKYLINWYFNFSLYIVSLIKYLYVFIIFIDSDMYA